MKYCCNLFEELTSYDVNIDVNGKVRQVCWADGEEDLPERLNFKICPYCEAKK